MTQSFSIHAHFYQPPREDSFTGIIPDESGAAPYRNWNERVLETCYRPNTELRNFSKLSFNIGPTLSLWMGNHAPDVLERIVYEDQVNQAIYGAGNAMAQPFNHRILPLANPVDKRTQIKWGITAFEKVFNRQSEGMWLPETAVDMETLRIMAAHGVKFTILAPWQVEVDHGQSPYLIDLGNRSSIVVFVYHGKLSSTMSFDTFATGNADAFAEFYVKPEIDRYNSDQCILIATDGELYGHHQPFRDKFLAHLMNGAIKGAGLTLTWPALWLKQHKVTGKARIVENTSWSCPHGVDRWKQECECTPGSAWKSALKSAFDRLNDGIFQDYCALMTEKGIDPVEARDDYIKVELGLVDFAKWLESRSVKKLDLQVYARIHSALSAQFAAQKMFTSCGWFFDDLTRIEPRNNIRYAAHAAYLMQKATAKDYTGEVVALLREAVDRSNQLTAADIFTSAYHRFQSS